MDTPVDRSERLDLKANLRLGLRGAFFRRVMPERVRASWSQLLALTAISLLIPFGWDFASIGLVGEFTPGGLPGALFGLPVMLFAAYAMARLAGRPEQTLMLATALCAISITVDACYFLLYAAAAYGPIPGLIEQGSYTAFHSAVAWFALAAGVAAIRLLGTPFARRLPTLALAAALLWIPLSLVQRDSALWREPYDDGAGDQYSLATPASEDAFYLQPKLLEHQLATLKPGRNGAIDLYFVGAAGYSGQDVFMKEVRYVSDLFHERFGTEGRSVTLVNNPRTVGEFPIASATSLGLTLKRIGEIMNRDEDILFLFLTSHGSEDHKLSLDFWPMRFKDLDPHRMRALLDQSGIKRRVIVVSACYSGGFVDALKDENSLVIAASAPDKNSFGCGNEADFTYFGKAYFDEALHKTDSFVEAFELAKPVIAEREKKENFTPSDPRIFVGDKIRAPLEQFLKQRKSVPAPATAAQPDPIPAKIPMHDPHICYIHNSEQHIRW